MSTIGERLRLEREKLGLSQTEFGELGGVQKRAQIFYEKDERSPDASYLAAVAKAGADLQFILTGSRGAINSRPLSPRVAALLSNFENMNEEDKRAIERLVTSLTKGTPV